MKYEGIQKYLLHSVNHVHKLLFSCSNTNSLKICPKLIIFSVFLTGFNVYEKSELFKLLSAFQTIMLCMTDTSINNFFST